LPSGSAFTKVAWQVTVWPTMPICPVQLLPEVARMAASAEGTLSEVVELDPPRFTWAIAETTRAVATMVGTAVRSRRKRKLSTSYLP
jgi:hypothetical protein